MTTEQKLFIDHYNDKFVTWASRRKIFFLKVQLCSSKHHRNSTSINQVLTFIFYDKDFQTHEFDWRISYDDFEHFKKQIKVLA